MMIPAPPPPDPAHVTELQSLRGIAALIVVLHHCSFYYTLPAVSYRAVELLLNAHAAVVLFFVLSGFLLALSLQNKPLTRSVVIPFYVRRAFRLYPMLWVAVVLAFAYSLAFQGRPLPNLVNDWWWTDRYRVLPDATATLTAFAGVRTTLPLPIWTLAIEIAGSAALPVIVLAWRRSAILGSVLVLLAVAMTLFGHMRGLGISTYFLCFIVGAGGARHCQLLAPLARGRRAIAVAALALAMLWFGRWGFVADYRHHYDAPMPVIVETVGAAILIVLVRLRAGAIGGLGHRGMAWLGDVSYSLYLIHLPLIGLVAGYGERVVAPDIDTGLMALMLTLVVVPLSLLLAAAGVRLVERPAMRLGRLVASRLAVGSPRRAAV